MPLSTPIRVAVIGGGPAGLRAAEVASAGGAAVELFDAKPSVGRKFLVAGRGGLNLTKAEPLERFLTRFSDSSNGEGNVEPETPGCRRGAFADRWRELIASFDSEALRAWAADLGVESFVASTGRVYPRGLKAAPLLRRWVERLRDQGVRFTMNRRWTGLAPGRPLQIEFTAPDGARTVATADAVVLALGGGSWPQTGSDGAWVGSLTALGVSVAPLEPANCGWGVAWPASVLASAEGLPVKNIVARAGAMEAAGELLITRHGLEGGALYQLCPALRRMQEPVLCIDFKPAFSVQQLVAKMGPARRNLLHEARRRWKLSDAAFAILEAQGGYDSIPGLAAAAKCCRISLTGPRPLAEAISSAGGICWSELSADLMIRRLPGIFACGEMLDWEAPTGGYLIHGCLATGTHAGNGALKFGALLS